MSVSATKQGGDVRIRARIALRKAGIKPSIKNVDDEIIKIRQKRGYPVNLGDIITAYEDGEEVSYSAIHYIYPRD